jgi:hypothetical protein
MKGEGTQNNFILRVTREKDTWKIRLLDVRSGKTLEFSSLEALHKYLEGLKTYDRLH